MLHMATVCLSLVQFELTHTGAEILDFEQIISVY